MHQMLNAFGIYSCYVRKMGAMEMLRQELWGVALCGSKAIALRVIMHFVYEAERKVKKEEEKRCTATA